MSEIWLLQYWLGIKYENRLRETWWAAIQAWSKSNQPLGLHVRLHGS
jgi:hypothetical protein